MTENDRLIAAEQRVRELEDEVQQLTQALKDTRRTTELAVGEMNGLTEQLQSLVVDIRASMARQMAQTYVLGTMNVLTIFDQAVEEVRQERMPEGSVNRSEKDAKNHEVV